MCMHYDAVQIGIFDADLARNSARISLTTPSMVEAPQPAPGDTDTGNDQESHLRSLSVAASEIIQLLHQSPQRDRTRDARPSSGVHRNSIDAIYDTQTRRQPLAAQHSLAALGLTPPKIPQQFQSIASDADAIVDSNSPDHASPKEFDAYRAPGTITPRIAATSLTPITKASLPQEETQDLHNTPITSPLLSRTSAPPWTRGRHGTTGANLPSSFDMRTQLRRPSDTTALVMMRNRHEVSMVRGCSDIRGDIWMQRRRNSALDPASFDLDFGTLAIKDPADPFDSRAVEASPARAAIPESPTPESLLLNGGTSNLPGSTATTLGLSEYPVAQSRNALPLSNVPSASSMVSPLPTAPTTYPYNWFYSKPQSAPYYAPLGFVIKSFNETDIRRSLEHGIWTSTKRGNQRLDRAWNTSGGVVPIYLFFSVNGSGRFCSIARMVSGVDHEAQSDIWSEGQWTGCFRVQWLLVKDVPNKMLRHIILTNTLEQKPVTQSRDTQELAPEATYEMLDVMNRYTSSALVQSSLLCPEIDTDN